MVTEMIALSLLFSSSKSLRILMSVNYMLFITFHFCFTRVSSDTPTEFERHGFHRYANVYVKWLSRLANPRYSQYRLPY